jgi:hypothetical protein
LKVGGDLQGDCCCGGAGDCGSVGCTVDGTPVPCPSLNISVFKADYVGGGIRWCNQTFSQSDIQGGVVKTACPHWYRRIQNSRTSHHTYTWSTGTWHMKRTIKDAFELWIYNFNSPQGSPSHVLQRAVNYNIYNGSANCMGQNWVKVAGRHYLGQTDRIQGWGCPPLNPTYSPMFVLGLLSVNRPGLPSYNNYRITNDFFGSSVISGLTFTWTKKSAWA